MTPGELFLSLWDKVDPYAGEVISTPWRGRTTADCAALVDALRQCQTATVPKEVSDYLAGKPVAFACEIEPGPQRAFVAMCALDEAAGNIHPSSKTRISGHHTRIGAMLMDMKVQGTVDGHYACSDTAYVIAKGKLNRSRIDNDATQASGKDLSHQFAYLTVVHRPGLGSTLKFISLPPSRFLAAGPANKVGFAPIAEDADDLIFTTTSRGDRAYLDTVAAASNLSDRANAAVVSLVNEGAGVVILPELVSDSFLVTSLSQTLRREGRFADVLVLSGTGPGAPCDTSARPYNEAVMLDGKGDELFRQRKVNLFNMDKDRMEHCGISPADGFADSNHMEDAAAGGELIICDLMGLGRVVVLICEDLEQTKPGQLVCEAVRPDWVLTPVLDVGPKFGRWIHTRSLAIGSRTKSRFIVSCSGTLIARRAKQEKLSSVPEDEAQIGMCVDAEEGFKAHFVSAYGLATPVRALVEWTPDTWERHYTGAASEQISMPKRKSNPKPKTSLNFAPKSRQPRPKKSGA